MHQKLTDPLVYLCEEGHALCQTCRELFYNNNTVPISYPKVHGTEMIFVASKAKLDGSKAIRGGIPICFPAFGAWPFGAQHGFARNSKDWKVTQQPKVDADTGDVEVSPFISFK